jgi:TRAP-type C4-dicarboxylate transport system permease small subunit
MEVSVTTDTSPISISCEVRIMKKLFLFVRDVFEIYLPVASFAIMFLTFLLQVFFRYVVNHPLTWTQEVIVVAFVWTVLLGTCYTMRRHAHVKFTLVYDRMKPKVAAVFRLVGNILIVVTFAALVVPSFRYSLFVGFQKTAVFRISYTYIFMPFVYFTIAIALYMFGEIIEDINVLRGRLADSLDHAAAEDLK